MPLVCVSRLPVRESIEGLQAGSQVRVAEAGNLGRWQCGNTEQGERPPFEAATKQYSREVTENTSLCVIMICKALS